MFLLHCFLFIIFVVSTVLAVPPAACRAEFRWDDCGKPAKPVMYYWKQGSRCEIGYWKGCLPNPNMFADEYECINTCVFVDRPSARTETEEPETETTTDDIAILIKNSTTIDNNTDDNSTGNKNEAEVPESTNGSDSSATNAPDNLTNTDETTFAGNGTDDTIASDSSASTGETPEASTGETPEAST